MRIVNKGSSLTIINKTVKFLKMFVLKTIIFKSTIKSLLLKKKLFHFVFLDLFLHALGNFNQIFCSMPSNGVANPSHIEKWLNSFVKINYWNFQSSAYLLSLPLTELWFSQLNLYVLREKSVKNQVLTIWSKTQEPLDQFTSNFDWLGNTGVPRECYQRSFKSVEKCV